MLDNLPKFEDLDITSAHIQSVARQIQGGAGPGAVMLFIGVIFCFTTVIPVYNYVTLWLLFVDNYVTLLLLGMTSELLLLAASSL